MVASHIQNLQCVCRTTRVINVSSDAHLFGDINTQNPNLTGEYNNWKAYGQSKLANVMFTFELAQRVPAEVRVDTNTLHPGVVSTELARCATVCRCVAMACRQDLVLPASMLQASVVMCRRRTVHNVVRCDVHHTAHCKHKRVGLVWLEF